MSYRRYAAERIAAYFLVLLLTLFLIFMIFRGDTGSYLFIPDRLGTDPPPPDGSFSQRFFDFVSQLFGDTSLSPDVLRREPYEAVASS